MPIRFVPEGDEIYVEQTFQSPTVYLDHWAIRKFTDDFELQNRLVNAMMGKAGTLLLSTITFAEFASASDSRPCSEAEDFLDRLLPNIFFTNFDIGALLKREQREPNNRQRFWPPADLSQLTALAKHGSQGPPYKLTMRGVISPVHEHRAMMLEALQDLAWSLREAFVGVRGDSAYVQKARTVPPSDRRLRTMVIFGELMRGFNLDPNSPIEDNDVIDLLHAAIPINCCDFVLLDGPWAERVQKMNQRLKKSSMNMPVAICFSPRSADIARFLSELECFDKDGHSEIAAKPW
jgi:hypothetical protein